MTQPEKSYRPVTLSAEDVQFVYELAVRLTHEGENPPAPPFDMERGLAWAMGVLTGKALMVG